MENPVPERLLALKLSKILGDLKNVPKNGWNDFHKYAYVTESDILESIRDNLSKEKIFLYCDQEEPKLIIPERNFWQVCLNFTFVDGITGQSFKQKAYGHAMDVSKTGMPGDKAIYKAITGAIKYFLMKNFLMSTGDDPENETPEKNIAPKPQQQAPHREEPKNMNPDYIRGGSYIVQFGKFKGQTFEQIGLHEIKNYFNYIDKKSKEDGKPIQGAVLEFMQAANLYIEQEESLPV